MAKVLRKDDKGYQQMMSNLSKGTIRIQAGIFGTTASTSSNGSAADVLGYRLAIHDQGLGPAYANGGAREVLIPTVEELKNKHATIIGKKIMGSLASRSALSGSLTFAANRFAGIMINTMKNTRGKSPRTLLRARSSTPLVDTADMIKAIKGKVK